MGLTFEWDPRKAAQNLKKHGVSFEEASTVFGDPLGATASDPDHSHDEDRYLLIGASNRGRMLIVSFLERGRIIRLISARMLTRKEQQQYEEAQE